MLLGVFLALNLIPAKDFEAEGLYARGMHIVVGAPVGEASWAPLGHKFQTWRTEEGIKYVWKWSGGATFTICLDMTGKVSAAGGEIESSRTRANVNVYVLIRYKGRLRKVVLGKTSMGEMRKWSGTTDMSINSEAKSGTIKPQDFYSGDGLYEYGWAFPFAKGNSLELRVFTLWKKNDRSRTQSQKDRTRVKVLWLGPPQADIHVAPP